MEFLDLERKLAVAEERADRTARAARRQGMELYKAAETVKNAKNAQDSAESARKWAHNRWEEAEAQLAETIDKNVELNAVFEVATDWIYDQECEMDDMIRRGRRAARKLKRTGRLPKRYASIARAA